MRLLKLQMQMSIDGFVATGPNDQQEWVTWAMDEIQPQVLEILDTADTNIIGRKLAIDYIPYWEDVFTHLGHEMYQIAQRIVRMNKIIFSKTISRTDWQNTKLANGDLVMEVQKLKNQPGKDMVVYGGSSFVSSLVRENLIDDFHFFVNPVVLGKGDSIFDQLAGFKHLKLKKSKIYNSGIVLLNYQLK